MAFIEVMKATIFKNLDRFAGAEPIMRGKPNYSNGKITLHTAIPAGEYSISCWQYLDTGNIGLIMSRREQEQEQPQPRYMDGTVIAEVPAQQAQPAQQAPAQPADDAISDLGGETDGFR